MGGLPGTGNRRRKSSSLNPAVGPRNTDNDDLFKGPIETFDERVERDRGDFLRNLYGDQDEDLPKPKRGRRTA